MTMNALITSWGSYVAPAAIFLLALMLAGFLYWRGARLVFLDRIWLLFHKREYYDEELRGYHQAQLDLERFKFMYRIPSIQSLSQARAAQDWATEVGMSLSEMVKARSWVDWEKKQIKDVSTSGNITVGLFCIVVALATTFPFVWAISGDMLVRFKASDTWVWVGGERARSIELFSKSDPWVLSQANCDPASRPTTTLEPDEANMLCDSFGSDEFKTYVSEIVLLQRWVMGILTIMMVVVCRVAFIELFARLFAWDLKKRIKRNACGKAAEGPAVTGN